MVKLFFLDGTGVDQHITRHDFLFNDFDKILKKGRKKECFASVFITIIHFWNSLKSLFLFLEDFKENKIVKLEA